MTRQDIVAILQGLHPMITTCKLNELEYTRLSDGWYQGDEWICG